MAGAAVVTRRNVYADDRELYRSNNSRHHRFRAFRVPACMADNLTSVASASCCRCGGASVNPREMVPVHAACYDDNSTLPALTFWIHPKTTDLWPCYLERVRAMTGAGGDGEDGVPASNAPSSLEIAILTHHHHHQHTMEKFKALVSAFSAHYLKAPERAMLARAAERDGEDGEVGPCLMLPREVSLPSNTSTDTTKMRKSSSCVKVCPVALLAQLLRWPDLNASAKDVDSHLCRLAFLCSGDSDGGGAGASCKSAGSSSPESGVGRENAMLDGGDRLECCNPFHWSRAIKECDKVFRLFWHACGVNVATMVVAVAAAVADWADKSIRRLRDGSTTATSNGTVYHFTTAPSLLLANQPRPGDELE
ncbi:hypothetical protein BV898_01664 [Hypsibius exemplaris]|uniref:Uncharacterized protein n=1 Tax=Hypsibius exemplaris TaxID=2072580 RepID=A0A1W0XB11_HYPEX|nr:hypothetical protein BV898_01664 [Hypsibius exemplaris]